MVEVSVTSVSPNIDSQNRYRIGIESIFNIDSHPSICCLRRGSREDCTYDKYMYKCTDFTMMSMDSSMDSSVPRRAAVVSTAQHASVLVFSRRAQILTKATQSQSMDTGWIGLLVLVASTHIFWPFVCLCLPLFAFHP